MNNAMMITAKDNVAVVIEAVDAGADIFFERGGEAIRLNAAEPIPIYHKFAVEYIKKDDKIVKYGEIIGVATSDIKPGMHVHCHNVISETKEVQL